MLRYTQPISHIPPKKSYLKNPHPNHCRTKLGENPSKTLQTGQNQTKTDKSGQYQTKPDITRQRVVLQ